MTTNGHLIGLTLLLTTSLLACVPKMRDTKEPATATAWDTVEHNAKTAGYPAEQSPQGSRDGRYFWYVKVMQGGGTIYYTKNNATGGVAFTCSGGALDESSVCDKAGLALLKGR